MINPYSIQKEWPDGPKLTLTKGIVDWWKLQDVVALDDEEADAYEEARRNYEFHLQLIKGLINKSKYKI